MDSDGAPWARRASTVSGLGVAAGMLLDEVQLERVAVEAADRRESTLDGLGRVALPAGRRVGEVRSEVIAPDLEDVNPLPGTPHEEPRQVTGVGSSRVGRAVLEQPGRRDLTGESRILRGCRL